MPHFRSFFDRQYLYAFDLQGRDVTLTIENVTGGVLKGPKGESKKPLCHFREGKEKKPLALNSTNAKVIAQLYGNDTSDWVGKKITIYPTTCDAFGQTVECIRVRPIVPKGNGKNQKSDNDGGV